MSSLLILARAGLAVAAAVSLVVKGQHAAALMFLAYALADGAALWMTSST
jgi:hypothetical protein